MVDTNYILAPQIVKVRFDIAPAFNGLESIRSLNETHRLFGMSEWLTQTAARLPQERLDLNAMIFEAASPLFFEVVPVMQYDDYEQYVDAIAARDPYQLRDAIVQNAVQTPQHYPEFWDGDPSELTVESFLHDPAIFHRFISAICRDTLRDDSYWERAFALYNDPPQLLATIVEHMRWMWENVAAEEWERSLPMLKESVAAFETLDFSNMTLDEATRAVTTRDLSSLHKEKDVSDVDTVVFVPSTHIGPYVLRAKLGKMMYTVFGARLPRSVPNPASALNRAELLTRLNALADDTRLRILELLTKHEELCAQDIIEQLGMSQSSASRHLSQLSANGFIVERRRDVAKCYSLNTDRFLDTLRTLTNFLTRQ